MLPPLPTCRQRWPPLDRGESQSACSSTMRSHKFSMSATRRGGRHGLAWASQGLPSALSNECSARSCGSVLTPTILTVRGRIGGPGRAVRRSCRGTCPWHRSSGARTRAPPRGAARARRHPDQRIRESSRRDASCAQSSWVAGASHRVASALTRYGLAFCRLPTPHPSYRLRTTTRGTRVVGQWPSPFHKSRAPECPP